MGHEMTQGYRTESDLAPQHYALCDAGQFSGCCTHHLLMHPQLSSRRVYLLVYHGGRLRSLRSPSVEGGGG